MIREVFNSNIFFKNVNSIQFRGGVCGPTYVPFKNEAKLQRFFFFFGGGVNQYPLGGTLQAPES